MRLPPLTLEAIAWLAVPPLASLAVLLAGLRARQSDARSLLVGIAVAGLMLSALWFLLVLRIEGIERR